jgi:hypothetical protein
MMKGRAVHPRKKKAKRGRTALAGARAEIARLRGTLAECANEALRLREEIAIASDLMTESRRARELRREQDCARLADEHAHLASLHVASTRLLESVERDDVLCAIQEIVANLIGSEELVVYSLREDTRMLVPLTSMGIDAARIGDVPLGCGVVGRVAESGEAYVDEGARGGKDVGALTACIPLVLRGRVLGVVAIYRLLVQKPALEPSDRQLLQLLSTHAAVALHCSGAGRVAQLAS